MAGALLILSRSYIAGKSMNNNTNHIKIKSSKKSKLFWPMIILIALSLAIAFIWSFFVGRFELSIKDVIVILSSKICHIDKYWSDAAETIVIKIRFPRIVTAIMAGGALSVSGASYQTMFKNPMVSPDLLGVSAGASFGAALVMLHSGAWWQIQASALVFGLVAVAGAYIIAALLGKRNLTVLVLAGVVISSLFQSFLSIIKTLADTEDALPSITYWLMGSLSKSSNDNLGLVVGTVVIMMAVLFLFRHQIDAMAAGEAEARTMGVNVNLVKIVVIVCSTLMTVVTVSICGIVGWVGLVVPHISRAFVGASYGKLITASFLIGGLFLLIVDNLIRGATAVDLPLGVMTALVGTPVFIAIIAKSGKEWR